MALRFGGRRRVCGIRRAGSGRLVRLRGVLGGHAIGVDIAGADDRSDDVGEPFDVFRFGAEAGCDCFGTGPVFGEPVVAIGVGDAVEPCVELDRGKRPRWLPVAGSGWLGVFGDGAWSGREVESARELDVVGEWGGSRACRDGEAGELEGGGASVADEVESVVVWSACDCGSVADGGVWDESSDDGLPVVADDSFDGGVDVGGVDAAVDLAKFAVADAAGDGGSGNVAGEDDAGLIHTKLPSVRTNTYIRRHIVQKRVEWPHFEKSG